MRIAVFDDFRLGVVVDEDVVDVTPLVPDVHPAMRPHLLAELISRYDEIREELQAPKGPTLPLKDVRLRQDGVLKDLIIDVPGLIEQASAVLPLQPGDLIATGTPAGVGELHPGDEVVVASPQIGRMDLNVRSRTW